MYMPESTDAFAFFITYDVIDIIILVIIILAIVGFMIYKKRRR